MNEERLARFEDMLIGVQDEYENVRATLEELRSQGKVRTATYQQLFARKMTLDTLFSLYERYGLLKDGEKPDENR